MYKPNFTDGTATKLSGMMEITGRLYAETKDIDGETLETRKLFFGSASDMATGNKVKTLNVDSILMDETKGYENLLKAIKGGDGKPVEVEEKKEEDTNEPPSFIKASRKKD